MKKFENIVTGNTVDVMEETMDINTNNIPGMNESTDISTVSETEAMNNSSSNNVNIAKNIAYTVATTVVITAVSSVVSYACGVAAMTITRKVRDTVEKRRAMKEAEAWHEVKKPHHVDTEHDAAVDVTDIETDIEENN